MAARVSRAFFSITTADAQVLLADLDRNEPSALYAYLVKQLTAARPGHPPRDVLIAGHYVESFRGWLDRAQARHARAGQWEKAEAFARVRKSEHQAELGGVGALRSDLEGNEIVG